MNTWCPKKCKLIFFFFNLLCFMLVRKLRPYAFYKTTLKWLVLSFVRLTHQSCGILCCFVQFSKLEKIKCHYFNQFFQYKKKHKSNLSFFAKLSQSVRLQPSPNLPTSQAKQNSNPTWGCNVYYWVCQFLVILGSL